MCPKAIPEAREKKARGVRFIDKQIPLYYQLATLLREKIVAGHHGPGDRFPTEADLVGEYGLSRITVRQALRSMEEQGLIERRPGKGTFVAGSLSIAERPVFSCSLEGLISTCLCASPVAPEISRVTATPDDAACLHVKPRTALIQVGSVYYCGNEACGFVVSRIPAKFGQRLSARYLKRHSVLEFLERRSGILLADAEQSLRATLADARLAYSLEIRVGAPLLLVESVLRTEDGCAVMRTLAYCRSDVCRLTTHLVRDARARQATDIEWAYRGCKGLAE